MSKSTGNKVRVETWSVKKGTAQAAVVTKVAVRNSAGQFHGATNFRGSVLSK